MSEDDDRRRSVEATAKDEKVLHDFEIELSCLVTTNHRLTLTGIDHQEEDELVQVREDLLRNGVLPSETGDAILFSREGFYDLLRHTANGFAIVAVVIRFDSWITRLWKKLPLGARNVASDPQSRLLGHVVDLNAYLGDGPVAVEFFSEVETVRDSIVHGDSKAVWSGRSKRAVAERYVSGLDVEITQAHVADAVAKAVLQVEWYDQKLAQKRSEP